ncbi:hypothetical protein MKleb_5847 (plasmid) [Klebsiella sp. PL-2018]|nr:hypothetical protein MKleb_5847 [Klebsiella sp. PL-2018]
MDESRNPPQRRRARARNGVAPYTPAAVGFAGVFRAQATARLGRRIRNGCCKPALDLSHQTLASARNRLRVRRSLAGAQQLPLAEWGSTTGCEAAGNRRGASCRLKLCFLNRSHHNTTRQKASGITPWESCSLPDYVAGNE